jgi:hypothetical protein
MTMTMTGVLDRTSSFFAAVFLVMFVLGVGASTQPVWAAEPLTAAVCGFDEDCTYTECDFGNWCYEPYTCACGYDEYDVCNCYDD